MSPIQIALLLLAVAGVWAVIELALTLRKTRTVVDSLDKTVGDLNNTLAEAQPVVAKLDGAVAYTGTCSGGAAPQIEQDCR